MTPITVLLVVMGFEFCIAGEGALVAMGEEVARDHRGVGETISGEFGVQSIVLSRCCGTRGSRVAVGVSGMGKNGRGIGVSDRRGERWVVSVSFGHACLTSTRTIEL